MNQRIKKMWLEALRSGKYLQAVESLAKRTTIQRKFRYCCLGVLCDLYRKANTIPRPEEVKEGDYIYQEWNSRGLLPKKVMRWAGLTSPDPIVNGRTLSAQNDLGKTFGEIAALIEEHL